MRIWLAVSGARRAAFLVLGRSELHRGPDRVPAGQADECATGTVECVGWIHGDNIHGDNMTAGSDSHLASAARLLR